MAFSRRQQPEFRKLVALAWAAHCRLTGAAGKMDRGWYEDTLEAATGYRSTSECNAGRDYDAAMAEFEAIAGTGVKWGLKLHGGDAKRIAHNIRQICEDHDIDEGYMRRVARKALRLDTLPELLQLDREQLLVILRACKQHVTRNLIAERKHEPQVSRKTGGYKKLQVQAYQEAIRREIDAEEVPPENIPF